MCVRACVHLRERLGAEVEMKPSSRGSSPRRTASTTRCSRSPPSSLSTPHTPGTQALTAHAGRCCGTTFGPAAHALSHIYVALRRTTGIRIDASKMLAGAQHPRHVYAHLHTPCRIRELSVPPLPGEMALPATQHPNF